MADAPRRRQLSNHGSRPSSRPKSLTLGFFGFLIGMGLASFAAAHGRSVSYSSWQIDSSGAVVTVRIKSLELSRLGPEAISPRAEFNRNGSDGANRLTRRFSTDLVLVSNGKPCAPEALTQHGPDETGWVRIRWRLECPLGAGSLVIRSRILLEVAPSHLHFARVRFLEDQDHVREKVLTEASPSFEVRRPDDDSSPGRSNREIGSEFPDYLQLGIQHILTGWDHLAFVFGLLLLASRFGEVARLVTGFTLAHSLTLALAVQGLVHPRSAAIEAIIAFSVALVAVEKSWGLSGRNRAIPMAVLIGLALLGLASLMSWISLPIVTIAGLLLFTACYFSLASRSDGKGFRIGLTFAFGLVHGFGFAGILVEMSLPTDRLVPALIGFNLGVEFGQIGVILLLWPLLRLGSRFASGNAVRLASESGAAALCGLGLYWLLERVLPL